MSKVLVIEDDAALGGAIARALSHSGHQASVARNGNDGLELFLREQPSVVITDILMPEREGLETIRAIRNLNPDTKIIAISGASRTLYGDYLVMAAKLGACEIMAKPFGARELLTRVSVCLRLAAQEKSHGCKPT
jgi:DNA-binding response OmpR family regulator